DGLGLLVPPPAPLSPLERPTLSHGPYHVLRIAVELYRTPGPQRLQPCYHGIQLHPVVGGQSKAARKLLPVLSVEQDYPVSARARITKARTVGVDDHVFWRIG